MQLMGFSHKTIKWENYFGQNTKTRYRFLKTNNRVRVSVRYEKEA